MSALANLFPGATPRPWFGGKDMLAIGTRTGSQIAFLMDFGGERLDEDRANTALILHAVNTYDARDALLRRCAEKLRSVDDYANEGDYGAVDLAEQIEAALAVKP